MSRAPRDSRTGIESKINNEKGPDSAEVAEAIKALEVQLADLRKIVQAAKTSDSAVIKSNSRQ